MNKAIVAVLTIIWLIVIFSFSSEPAAVSREKSQQIRVQVNKMIAQNTIRADQKPIQLTEFHIRKSAHIMEYVVLGILLTLLLIDVIKRKVVAVWVIGTAVACIDEYIQHFAPGRGPQVRDVVFDSLGLLTGIVCIHVYLKVSKRAEAN